MFGDILVWVLTLFGLIPPSWTAKVWGKMFGRKKDFHEQLAEFSDERFAGVVDTHVRFGPGGSDLSDHFGIEDETTERVYGPWGVVPYKCQDERAWAQGHPYSCRIARRL